ncbi:hypothetical protein [Roseibium sp. RKSG952]|uniref:hypothetical protein n=1 Tax=Roseibium sp. RKSG952 TaxID=2529384 RepID=UPI0018AD188A|nr:hypothetical protein [Roseibium sp. RKSG952]
MPAKKFDWTKSCSYDNTQKAAFHRNAKKALKALAQEMGLVGSEYDIRSNKGGGAVSGEITLHTDDIYVQVSQPSYGRGNEILIRTCKDRKDYTGGQNHFAAISRLDDILALSDIVLKVRQQKVGFNADEIEDPGYNPHYLPRQFK